MFIWLNVLCALLLFPFMFAFGMPTSVARVKRWLPDPVAAKFPVSKHTPVVVWAPHAWLSRAMVNWSAGAWALTCFIMVRLYSKRTMAHEALHVVQQSALSPPLVGVTYGLDVINLLPFKSQLPERSLMHMPVAEQVAYELSDDVVG